MPFVMFDVYSCRPLGLNGDDAERLALLLDAQAASDLAGRVRYGLANSKLVQLAPEERELLAAALDDLVSEGCSNVEQASKLAANLRARAAGGDLIQPPVE